MAHIEPGIYRIINIGRGTAITVRAASENTIVGWETPNQPGQQWLVRRFGGQYHISDCLHGRYIVADNTKIGALASLGRYPTAWEIKPAEETARIWSIKLPEYDLVLDLYNGENGSKINLRKQDDDSDRRWKFERLEGLPNDEHGPSRSGTEEKDRIIAQMAEQIAQQGKQLVELAGQLAEQNQRIADLYQKITDQERDAYSLKRQLEEKEQQLEQANKEAKDLLARTTQGQDPPYHGRMAGTASSSTAGADPGEVVLLRNEVDRLKSRMNILMQALTI